MPPSFMAPRTCMFCLAESAMEIRFDKRTRPYLVCRICFARAFVRNIESIRGMAVVPDLITAAKKNRESNPCYKEHFDGQIVALINQVQAALTSPPVRGDPDRQGLSTEKLPVPFEVGGTR
jgi:hypothetical protein